MINYTGSNENQSEFANFLDGQKNSKYEITQNCDILEIKKKSNANVLTSIPNKTSINFSPVAVNVTEISYQIFSQSKDYIPARKVSWTYSYFIFIADVPDSFFDLSKEELQGFKRGFQNISKSIIERPFSSTKTNMKSETSPPSRFVPIKLVLNDQIFVQAEFSLNWSGKLYQIWIYPLIFIFQLDQS